MNSQWSESKSGYGTWTFPVAYSNACYIGLTSGANGEAPYNEAIRKIAIRCSPSSLSSITYNYRCYSEDGYGDNRWTSLSGGQCCAIGY